MSNVKVYPGQSTDDVYGYSTNYYPTADILQFGFWVYARYAGIRFVNVTIPKGSTISAATIKVKASLTRSGLTNITIKGVAEANPATWASLDDLKTRTRGSQSVAWDPEDWTENNFYYSPDIANIIQEVIDQAGWASGNALAIVFENDPTSERLRDFHSFDSGSDYAELSIDYEYAPPEPPEGPAHIAKLSTVSIADIAKFKGVPLENIKKVNSVD